MWPLFRSIVLVRLLVLSVFWRHLLLTLARCCSKTSWNCPAKKKQTSSGCSGRSRLRLSLRSAFNSTWLSSNSCSISTISTAGWKSMHGVSIPTLYGTFKQGLPTRIQDRSILGKQKSPYLCPGPDLLPISKDPVHLLCDPVLLGTVCGSRFHVTNFVRRHLEMLSHVSFALKSLLASWTEKRSFGPSVIGPYMTPVVMSVWVHMRVGYISSTYFSSCRSLNGRFAHCSWSRTLYITGFRLLKGQGYA